MMRFPEGFLWGAATSAYQIEGSPLADGAGVSNWHRFTHTPGRVDSGDTGDIACDHYRRFRDDVRLMKELGLGAYRFSIAWSRILPDGVGRVNDAGVDFYNRLVDELLSVGVAPMPTLFHWDLPAALDDRGGWLNPESPQWFAEYAGVMGRALGDRVPFLATMNEPWVVMDAGFLHGVHAPGHKSLYEPPRVARHLLLAHAAAVRALRSVTKAQLGIVLNFEPKDVASDRLEDREAAERAHAYMNAQFVDPLVRGKWPAALPHMYGEAWPPDADLDFAQVQEKIDFLGINYYTRSVNRNDPKALLVRASPVRQPQALYTETGWEVHPESLTKCLVWARDHFGDLPIYITENGSAFPDPASCQETLEDSLRVQYLCTHLAATHAAIQRGVNVRGYFAWSLLDNLEWAAGFSKRFGIVHVDFETQKRTPKRSALVYRDIIAAHGVGEQLLREAHSRDSA